MQRRNFLAVLGGLPFLGWLKPKATECILPARSSGGIYYTSIPGGRKYYRGRNPTPFMTIVETHW